MVLKEGSAILSPGGLAHKLAGASSGKGAYGSGEAAGVPARWPQAEIVVSPRSSERTGERSRTLLGNPPLTSARPSLQQEGRVAHPEDHALGGVASHDATEGAVRHRLVAVHTRLAAARTAAVAQAAHSHYM